MFYMVENIVKDQEHCDVLKTSLAANTLSLVCVGLTVHIINSGLTLEFWDVCCIYCRV